MANQCKELNVEKYIQWVITMSLTIWVYLSKFVYQLLPPKPAAKSREIFRKYGFTAIQGHPRSSIDLGANRKRMFVINNNF